MEMCGSWKAADGVAVGIQMCGTERREKKVGVERNPSEAVARERWIERG